MDKRKEFTQSLVSNLKSKISEFKNKKNKDRAERKNELDFEINKDLVNKFKKNHQSSLLQDNVNPLIINGSLPKETNTNGVLGNIKGNTNSDIQQPLSTTSKDSNNIILNKITQSNNIALSSLNHDHNNNNQHLNLNSQQTKSFPIKSKEHNNTPISNDLFTQQQTESKKIFNINSLLPNNTNNNTTTNLKSIPKKNSFSYTTTSIPLNKQNILYNTTNNNNNTNYTKLTSTKDKIHNFMNNLNTNKQTINKEQKPPTYTFNTYADSKYEPSLRERTTYVSSKYNSRKDGLDDFADFSLKNNRTDSLTKQKTFSNDNLFFLNEIPQKKKEKQFGNITQSEVRALAGKIRFLSHEDIRLMDKNVIEELISLSNVIKRTFDNK